MRRLKKKQNIKGRGGKNFAPAVVYRFDSLHMPLSWAGWLWVGGSYAFSLYRNVMCVIRRQIGMGPDTALGMPRCPRPRYVWSFLPVQPHGVPQNTINKSLQSGCGPKSPLCAVGWVALCLCSREKGLWTCRCVPAAFP